MSSKRPIAYGIDFGTSNSSISVAYADEAHLVPLGQNGDDFMPSIVYLDSSRQQLAGHDAVKQYLVTGGRRGVRLMSGLKLFLSDGSWSGTAAPWGGHLSPEDLVAVLIRALKRQADGYSGEDVRRAVLGHPIFFPGAEGAGWEQRNELAKRRLKGAAAKAGFAEVKLVEESTAALAGEDMTDEVLVSLDFGGGTFDVSVLGPAGRRGRSVLASEGVAVGGEEFNELLFKAFVASEVGLDNLYRRANGQPMDVPYTLMRFGTLSGALSMLADSRTRDALDFVLHLRGGSAIRPIETILYGGHTYAFHRSVEDLKIGLSAHVVQRLDFSRPGLHISTEVKRSDFAQVIGPHLDRVEQAVRRALTRGKVRPDDVGMVVRTGGSSQIPAFVARMNALFGAARVQARDAMSTVALGLGLEAIEEWA